MLQGAITLMPESSGSITLNTANPYNKPWINIKYMDFLHQLVAYVLTFDNYFQCLLLGK